MSTNTYQSPIIDYQAQTTEKIEKHIKYVGGGKPAKTIQYFSSHKPNNERKIMAQHYQMVSCVD